MPSYGNFVLDKGYIAESAITKFRVVKLGTAADSCTVVTADSEMPIGVAQYSLTAGQIADQVGASVRLSGISEMEASAGITKGAEVTFTANGRAVTATSGKRVIGVALQTCDGAGDRIAVQLGLPGYIKA